MLHYSCSHFFVIWPSDLVFEPNTDLKLFERLFRKNISNQIQKRIGSMINNNVRLCPDSDFTWEQDTFNLLGVCF